MIGTGREGTGRGKLERVMLQGDWESGVQEEAQEGCKDYHLTTNEQMAPDGGVGGTTVRRRFAKLSDRQVTRLKKSTYYRVEAFIWHGECSIGGASR